MTGAALLALTLAQFTSLQLPPISFQMDTTNLSLVDPCLKVSERWARITNTGRATLFITQGLVTGPYFNGALQGGTLGNVKPGEFMAMGALFAPGPDDRPQRGEFEIRVRYHDSTVELERERIRKLAAQRAGEFTAEAEKLETAFLDRFERLTMKLRLEHQRVDNANQKKRAEALKKKENLQREYQQARREYEEGQFCSGCNQTRSVILAKGERFPHEGERVVPASRAQLAALEARYDGLIQQANNRAQAAQDETEASNRELQRRLAEFSQQRREAKAALDASLAALEEKQNELLRQKKALEHELHQRSTESRTVLVKLYGKCTRRTP